LDSFRYKIIREIQLKNNDFFVLIYGFIIPVDVAIRAADYFHVSVSYILGLSEERRVVSAVHKSLYMMDQHADFMFDYLTLSAEEKECVNGLVNRLKMIQDSFQK